MRLFPNARFPLLPPSRDPGGRNAGAGAEGRQGGAGKKSLRGSRRNEARICRLPGGKNPVRSIRDREVARSFRGAQQELSSRLGKR